MEGVSFMVFSFRGFPGICEDGGPDEYDQIHAFLARAPEFPVRKNFMDFLHGLADWRRGSLNHKKEN
jgi:hypothetical protein